MTRLLAEAFDKAAQLPDELQDDLARELLDMIASAPWDSMSLQNRTDS